MKTGCFRLNAKNQGAISIARWAPKWAGNIPEYGELAPGPWFKSVDRPTYVKRYRKILSGLDAQRVWDDLHNLVYPHEPVLLCWESPGEFCHRRGVAKWLSLAMGEPIKEIR